MSWWRPWKRESRSAATGYTASITSAFQSAAEGGSDVSPLATAALEMASGLYARCMSAAVVENAPDVVDALTPSTLSLIARNLIRRGADHHLIVVRGGRVELRPQGFVYATGASADPAAWVYAATEYGPSDSVHRQVPASAMLHCRYSVDSARPWIGIPPWSWASTTSAAIAALDRMVAREASAPHGSLLGLPESPQIDADGDVRPLDGFRQDLAQAKGRTLVMERARDWSEQTPQGNPARLEHLRYGLEREAIDPLRTATGRDVLAACGVPPTLVTAAGDGTAQRESFRRFLHSSLRPLARLMEAELRVKLDAPELVLDLSELHAADVAGRARAYKAFISSGVAPEDAAKNAGITLSQPMRDDAVSG